MGRPGSPGFLLNMLFGTALARTTPEVRHVGIGVVVGVGVDVDVDVL